MDQTISARDLSEIIGSIYDCALDPTLWPTTLADLRRSMNLHNAFLTLLDMSTGNPLLLVIDGVEPPFLELLARNAEVYARDTVAQWGGPEKLARLPLEEPLLLSRENPDFLTGFRYSTEWAIPQGIVDVMAIGLTRDASAIGNIAFARQRDAGPITDHELDIARLFVPHLKRAVTISRLLEAKSVKAATYEAVFDALATGVLLVTSDMRMIHANRAAEAMLNSCDPLCLRAGKVTGAAAVEAALSVAVARSADRGGMGRQGLGVPARSMNGAEYVMHVLPLQADSIRGMLPGATAAIFIATASAPRAAPIDAIAALFDLTPAEARVLDRIAAGQTIPECAQDLGIAVSTVRTHLLRLFEKTRTSRQSELIALATAFSLPLR